MIRRSMLFLPGTTPAIVVNGATLQADSIIIDLEDAVNPAEKDAARILAKYVVKEMQDSSCEVVIRINGLSTPFWEKDLEVVVPSRPDAILLPKTDGVEDLKKISRVIGDIEMENGIDLGAVKIICLIETAKGLKNVYEIADFGDRVVALFFGAADFATDMQIKRTTSSIEMNYAKSRLVNAARSAGIDCYDTPFLDTDNIDGLKAELEMARNFGFSGKAAINPRQVSYINEWFSPSKEELRYAHAVLEALKKAAEMGRGVVMLGNQMIDGPDILRAKRIIEIESAIKGVKTDE